MEAYSSSSSSSSKSTHPLQFQSQSQSWLHSVKKVNAKPWKKPAVAPMPPTPVRVYKVDPINFRDLVQQLTAAPRFQPDHKNAAPSLGVASPPNPNGDIIDIAPSSPPSTWSTHKSNLSNNNGGWNQDVESKAPGSMPVTPSLFELNLLSPSSYNWSSFPLMSPGTWNPAGSSSLQL
ncbi:hypothetical protein L6164_027937 [Bauhinia variegata]|uniref:Uncharacterized protein n=1 Tax=Bauhinia variegata TaxID=167791 RepID=A0ACB9LUK4_BAUVA|nr:hypothetical protein L6164_027937 [Bauhinia variegata]